MTKIRSISLIVTIASHIMSPKCTFINYKKKSEDIYNS